MIKKAQNTFLLWFFFLIYYILGLNAYLTIPLDISSFNQTHSVQDIVANNYSALFLFLALAFFSNMAMTVPWMMISEIFPFR